MPWPLIVAFLAGSSSAIFFGFAGTYRMIQGWKKTLESCGLSVTTPDRMLVFRLKLEAIDGQIEVRIKSARRGIGIVIVVPGPPGFGGVRIRREMYRNGAREIEVGDPAFDHSFFIEGPTRLVFTLLDAKVRGLLLDANAGFELEIARGEIRVEISPADLSILLPVLLEVARRFSERPDAAARLAENAREDPQAGVRLKNLLLLVREFPGEPGTLESLHAACSDASPEVRLHAAMELGAEGRAILLELAEGEGEDAWSAQAVASLGRELSLERTQDLLVRSLRRRRVQTARACLEALGDIGVAGGAAAVDSLVKVMAVERGELAAVAASALGTIGDAAAEPPLIQALGRENAPLRLAAATALGRVGSTAAVLPLKEEAERFPADRDLGRAIRQAIAEIQSRLQGASPGQLSLAGTGAGQLSLAPAEAGQLSFSGTEAGRLSLATDPAGQLSLPPADEKA